MRKEKRDKNNEESLDIKKMLYVSGTVFAIAIIVFAVTFFIYENKNNKQLAKNKKNNNVIGNIIPVEETSTSYGKTVVEQIEKINEEINNNTKEENNKKVAINIEKNNEEKEEKNKKEIKKTKIQTKKEEKEEKIKDPEFKKPVKGDIIKEFASNKLLYSNTLDLWTTHNGIDIKADKTTVVKSSANGKVISIKNDPRYGLTIIIEHANGYKTVYANLLSTEFVVEGEKVKQGDSIGTVGDTASFEVLEEPHLHFELLKDNEQQDPELFLIDK